MSKNKKTHGERLKALRVTYAAKLQDKLSDLKATADLVVVDNAPDRIAETLIDLTSQAHKLAGSAGTFGFLDVGDAAKKIELFCQPLINNDSLPSQHDCEELSGLVVSLLNCSDQTYDSEQMDQPSVSHKSQPENQDLIGDQVILLVEDDPEQSARLKIGLSAHAYDVRVIDNPSKTLEAINAYQPTAIILDLEFNEGPTAGAESIQKIQSSLGIGCPLIVLTSHRGFDARLASVKAGCDQFLTKPVKFDELITVLDKFTIPNEEEPERVLAIDDDPDILEFIEGTLQSSTMIVELLTDPSLVIEKMEEFRPEIIIIDLHMPKCSGKELATIIRQKPEFMGVPIVFLSAETDKDMQLEAMGVGADDFLTKPINPLHLLGAIRTRVERFRTLRNLMRRDSMTGLYNHATTWQLFETELSRASRSDTPVSFAMLDIDHFKSVNDTLGHGVGDIVIKTLSKLLMHRLRKGDIIGRLGGEEFGVVLPSTTVDQAHAIMEGVRLSFAEISQSAAGSDKPITLSCGIAESPEYTSTTELAESADHALYEAKSSGRNKTVFAHASKPVSRVESVSPTDRAKADSQQPIPVKRTSLEAVAELSKSGMPSTLKRAVVIDDDPMIGEFIKPFAEDAGFRVEIFTDAALFVANHAMHADLILLDLNMPVMDGIEVLRFLGENRCPAAIVIISGYDREILTAARSLAKRQGLNVVTVLSKPFDHGELKKIIELAYDGPELERDQTKRPDKKELPLVDDLREAIENKNLEVYYQPKIRLSDRAVAGAEALVRWNHPVKGFISPEYFVGLAEQNDLIDDLTLFVLKETCDFLKRCHTDGHSLKISVNISDRSFADLGFPERIAAIVTSADLSSSDIILELTETSLSADITHVIDILTRLRMKGFEISIDDFGTGHSSLSRLNELPFNELKIDQSFVGKAHAEAGARAIVKNTIELAKGLKLKTVAEGAETQEDMDILAEFNCDLVQGYFISRPIPPNAFIEWIEAWKNNTSSKPKLTATGLHNLVLYVDDNPGNVQFMQKILSQFDDIKMLTANNAVLGIDLAQTHKPDLILMDINMPEMDGYEALERLKIIEETHLIPIVAVSALTTKSDIMRGRHAGFADYISKPINVPEMIEVIKEILER